MRVKKTKINTTSERKIKTSVTLSPEVLEGIDALTSKNRSAFIEKVLINYIASQLQSEKDEYDLKILNSSKLDKEIEDALDYQDVE